MTKDEVVRELERLAKHMDADAALEQGFAHEAFLTDPLKAGRLSARAALCSGYAVDVRAIIAKAKDGRSCDTCRYGGIVRKPGARFMVCANLQCPGPKAARMSQYACWEAKEAS